MSLKIDDNNYQTYKAVFDIICRHIYKDLDKIISPDNHPIAVLNSWEAKSKSIAKRGLKAGLLEMSSTIKEYPQTTIANINADLRKNGLPSINKITAIVKDTIKDVLKKKRIKDIYQYYIIKEILDDTASDVTVTDQEELSKYIADFEGNAR